MKQTKNEVEKIYICQLSTTIHKNTKHIVIMRFVCGNVFNYFFNAICFSSNG